SEVTYKKIITNCFRYLNARDLYEIEVMSLFEYEARMHSHRLSDIDKERDMHMRAWLSQQVTATTKANKPQYKEFKEFFDYEKLINEIEKGIVNEKIKPQFKKMAGI